MIEDLVEVEAMSGEELKAARLTGKVMINTGKGARADEEVVGARLVLICLGAWQLLKYREANLGEEGRQHSTV